jgi:branched-chain amino acid transport system permease protein
LTVGGFTMVTMLSWGLPWPLALLAAMVITGLVAAAVERVVIRPMIGRPVFVTIILTLFVAYLLRALVVILWDTDIHGMPTPWPTTATLTIAGARVLYNSIGAMVAGGAALVVFFVLLKYSRLGVGMRATNTDQEVALALGIPVGRIFMATWFLAGMYAALAGVFLSMFPRHLDSNLGLAALSAFPAVIVGGLTSPVGAVVAGLLLGLSEVMAQRYLEPVLGDLGRNIHVVFPYLIMIAFLMIRPHGLFGARDVERL